VTRKFYIINDISHVNKQPTTFYDLC